MSRAVLTLASSTCLMGCLITREPVYQDPPNLPASVVGSTETPMFQIQIIDLEQLPTGADAGPGDSELKIFAIVRDPNVQDDLEGRVFLNLDHTSPNPNPSLVEELDIPPETSGDPYSRRVELNIPIARLGPGCNWVQLEVSRAFARLPSRLPADPLTPGDVGTGVWFIGGVDGNTPIADMGTCPP